MYANVVGSNDLVTKCNPEWDQSLPPFALLAAKAEFGSLIGQLSGLILDLKRKYHNINTRSVTQTVTEQEKFTFQSKSMRARALSIYIQSRTQSHYEKHGLKFPVAKLGATYPEF